MEYYAKPTLSPEDFLKTLGKLRAATRAIANMQAEAAKLISAEDEKGKGTADEAAQRIVYTKDEIFNPVVDYNIAVLYSYTKNFAFAIDSAVKLLVSLDPTKDSYLFFKAAFFLLVPSLGTVR